MERTRADDINRAIVGLLIVRQAPLNLLDQPLLALTIGELDALFRGSTPLVVEEVRQHLEQIEADERAELDRLMRDCAERWKLSEEELVEYTT